MIFSTEILFKNNQLYPNVIPLDFISPYGEEWIPKLPNEKKGRNAKKEYGKWMDENWLAMGISYFYKREYDKAIEKFEYIVKMYPKDKSKYYAKLWLAKTYVEMEQFPEALSYINEIEVEREAKIKKDLTAKKTKERRKKYNKRKKKKTFIRRPLLAKTIFYFL